MLLALFVVQVSAVNAVRTRTLPLVARIAPKHPEIVLRRALLEFQVRRALTEQTYQQILQIAPMAPLAHEPPLFHGLQLLALGRRAAAGPYFEEARRRDPRARLVRLVLLDHYLRVGAVREAALEARVLVRLIPDSGRVLLPELVKLARDPATRAPLAEALAGDPIMGNVLSQLATGGADPAVVIDLARRADMVGAEGAADPWRLQLLSAMVERGQVAQARSLWARFAGLDEGAATGPIHDPDFRNLPGGPPFGWTLSQSATGYAEFADGPALVAEYYGRERAELAGQLIALRPGRYRLSFLASGQVPANAGRLAWTIICQGSNRLLVDLAIQPGDPQPRAHSAAFDVPADCPAARIRLVGTPAEFPVDQMVTISRLRLLPDRRGS